MYLRSVHDEQGVGSEGLYSYVLSYEQVLQRCRGTLDERNNFFISGKGFVCFSRAIKEMCLLFQQLNDDLRQNLKVTMQQKYQQPGEESITHAVDKLHQEVRQ